ncbi:MAG TPA: hypothetical protein VNX88_13070 [Terriglobales bacterium]|jgi:ElaB/YqjD/DUF883 family membrane-anchored ribosome-binding protein|nr:hypothetical protein [Terriglobales bacterium]
MKSTAVRQVQNHSSDVARLPVKVVEELRRTVDSAYDDVSRSIKRAKHTATDAIDDSRHQIKRHPLTAVGSAALAGLAVGFTLGWFARRSKRLS